MNLSRLTFATIDAAAIAALVASPSTMARCSWPNSGTRKPSTRQRHPGWATRSSASRSAARFVRWSPRTSIPLAQRDTTATRAAVLRTTGYSSSRASASCCLESFSAESARSSATPSPSRSKRTAAATRGPARHPRPASSAPATHRTPSPRSCLKSLRPVRCLAARARRRAAFSSGAAGAASAAAASEDADAAGGPVGGEGLPDDPSPRYWAPEPAVVGLATIVAHHEPMTGRNGYRLREGASPAGIAVTGVADERLLLNLAVQHHMAVLYGDPVARPRDDAV